MKFNTKSYLLVQADLLLNISCQQVKGSKRIFYQKDSLVPGLEAFNGPFKADLCQARMTSDKRLPTKSFGGQIHFSCLLFI